MTLKESFAYIEKECKKFDLTLNTSDKKIEEYYITLTGLDNEENEMNIDSKRIYLYDETDYSIEPNVEETSAVDAMPIQKSN